MTVLLFLRDNAPAAAGGAVAVTVLEWRRTHSGRRTMAAALVSFVYVLLGSSIGRMLFGS